MNKLFIFAGLLVYFSMVGVVGYVENNTFGPFFTSYLLRISFLRPSYQNARFYFQV